MTSKIWTKNLRTEYQTLCHQRTSTEQLNKKPFCYQRTPTYCIFICSGDFSQWSQPQPWSQDQTAYDQHQQHAGYPGWQQTEEHQHRVNDLERQVAELRLSLEGSDSTRQSLELELPRLKEEKERQIKGLEDQLIFLQTSFDAANLSKQSLEMEMSQLPNW